MKNGTPSLKRKCGSWVDKQVGHNPYIIYIGCEHHPAVAIKKSYKSEDRFEGLEIGN